MKRNFSNAGLQKMFILLTCLNAFVVLEGYAQLCNNPGTTIFGITPSADVHYVDITTGAVGTRINPPNSGTIPNLANAMGYNPLNGRLYYFKRNIQSNPQEFVTYDPITGTVTKLADCPSSSLINLGCCTANGLGFYCIDAFGGLFYYQIANNQWTIISTNVRNQANVTLASIISTTPIPTATSRIYGDLAIDGTGSMWILISGPNDYGVYKLPSPLPTTAVTGALTIFQQVPPTTPTPGLKSIGGVAFNLTGEMFISTNAGDNKIYRLEKNYTLTYLSTMTMDGLGTDLASCNYPMFVLPVVWKRFAVAVNAQENIGLAWSVVESPDTKEYQVQHSIDGVKWEVLATIDAKEKSRATGYYAYEHISPSKALHHYRVGRIDDNNGINFSDTKMISSYGSVSFAMWPNPADNILQIENSYKSTVATAAVMIFDQTGRMICRNVLLKGMNRLDVQKLSPGNYLVTVVFSNGEKVSHKFLKN